MKHMMGNFSGILYLCLALFSAWFINIRVFKHIFAQ